MIVELDPSFGFLWIISKLFFNLSDPMATSLKMSLTTVGKSGPPYTRVQSGHDLIRGDLRLGLPCELLIEGQIRGHLIFWSIQALTEVVQLTLPQHQKSWWPKNQYGSETGKWSNWTIAYYLLFNGGPITIIK